MSQEQRICLSALGIGSMVDSADPAVHPVGSARELRNVEFVRGKVGRRRGWARLFSQRLPFETCINAKDGAYRDTGGRLHRLWAGSNGRLYHALGENPAVWTEVTLHLDVAWTWDATCRAVFAPFGDDCMITFWQPPEAADTPPAGAQNLRFLGLSDEGDPNGLFHAYGVSMPAPANAPTLAAVAGGNIPFGVYDFFTTFLDAVTGAESDRSAIASITLAQPEAPDEPPLATVGAAGNVPAGAIEYAVCFLHATMGIRSPLSMPRQVILAVNSQVALSNIRLCPDAAPTWHREIYRRTAGGIYYRLATLTNNTVQVYNDNLATCPGAVAYDEGRQAINLTNIALYAGGGTPANGRTVYRRVYRQDNGTGYRRCEDALAEILNNAGTTYQSATEDAAGAAWVRSAPVPKSGIVCPGPDNTLLWLNDQANALPAQIYQSASDDMPEAVAVDAEQEADITHLAGTHDDPITSCEDARDGWVVGKRRAIHYMGRECGTCERVLKNRGNVAPGTKQVIDNRVVFLSADGPGYLNHQSPGDFQFCGSNPYKFDLSETWARVVRSRLPYASSFHWPSASLCGWVVQMCDDWRVGPHNDTAILWDYGVGGGGRVWVVDWTGCDSFMRVPAAGSDTDAIEACFAYGVAARLFDGQHGDGTMGVLSGTVIAVDGTLVDVDVSALQGQDVVGSILWVNGGTGSRVCRPVSACENADALIVSACGGRLRTAGALGIAAGSLFEVGGFADRTWLPFNAGNPQAMKTWLTAHVRTD